MATPSQRAAVARYDKTHTFRVSLKLNKKTDADIFSRISEEPNRQGYVKRLIRSDIQNRLQMSQNKELIDEQ